MNVEVKSKVSGEKTVVPIEEVRKGIKYGKDLTGYEKNMLGNGIGKMESKDYVYTVINSCTSTNPVVQNALAAQGVAMNAENLDDDDKKRVRNAYIKLNDIYFQIDRIDVSLESTELVRLIGMAAKAVADARSLAKKLSA